MYLWGTVGTRDHPHIRSPEGVMSCEEIRHWIRELMTTHRWPRRLLARVLGVRNAGAMKSKLKRSWIYPGEQLRFSRQIDRILSGELVPMKFGNRYDAVVADNPVPLAGRPVMAWLPGVGLHWKAPRVSAAHTLPSFAKVFT
jgi:hypothetical protein